MALSNTDTVPNTPISMHPQMDSGVPGVKDIQGNPVRPSGAVPFPNSMQPKDLALANSMQGMIDDQRAVAQETKKVLEQLGGLATRLTQMMGNGQSGYNDIGSNVVRVPDPNGGILLSPTGSVLGIGPTPMAHPSHAHVVYAPIPGTSAAANPFTSSSNYQDQNRSNPLVTAAPQPSVNAQGVSTSGQSNWDAIPNQEAQTGSGGGGGGNVVQAPDPNQGGESTSEKIETPAIVAAGLLHRNFQKGQSMQGLASELKNKGTFKGVPGVGKFLYGTAGTPAIAATAAATAADGTIIPAVEGAAATAETAGVLGGVAEGGGLLASAGGALMGSAAGPIGLGAGALFGAYKFGGDFLSHERASGAAFQSMEGGTNLQGQAERARQAGFGATQWGSLSGGQADKLFQGVTGLGWTGDKRQAGLNFATSNYRSMGMDPNESMTLLGSIAQNGAVNLNKLALALQDVTNTAASASLNTNLVRQSFASTFTALQGSGLGTGAGGSGGDAGALSAAVTNVITGMGPTVAKSGTKPDLTSTDQITREASALGMDPGTYLGKTMQTGGDALKAKARDAIMAQVLPSIQGTSKNWNQLQIDLAKNPTKLGQDPSKTLQEEVAMDTPGGAQGMSGFLKAAGAIGSDIDPNKNAPGVLSAYTAMLQGNLSGTGSNSLPNALTKAETDAAAAAKKAARDKPPWPGATKISSGSPGSDLGTAFVNAVGGGRGVSQTDFLSAFSGLAGGGSPGATNPLAYLPNWLGGSAASAAEPNAGSAGAPPGYKQGPNGQWYPPGQGSLTPGWNALSSLATPPSTPPKPTPPTPPPKVDVVLSWKDPSWGAKINAAINQIPTNATQIPPNPFSATS